MRFPSANLILNFTLHPNPLPSRGEGAGRGIRNLLLCFGLGEGGEPLEVELESCGPGGVAGVAGELEGGDGGVGEAGAEAVEELDAGAVGTGAGEVNGDGFEAGGGADLAGLDVFHP